MKRLLRQDAPDNSAKDPGRGQNPGNGPEGGSSSIPWHSAFVEAIQLELEDYRDVLEFHAEYQLTSEPLRIDCVVIRKKKDVIIKKNIAAIFRLLKPARGFILLMGIYCQSR